MIECLLMQSASRNKMISLTIFTPTYNRAETIVRTYDSLLRQSVLDFEWLIVDDGSTDGTENLVKVWIEEAPFVIRYICQENGGKYKAYNRGLINADGKLFFCVDSDDWLPNNTVEKILCYKDILMADNSLAGIIGLKEYQNKDIIGIPFTVETDRSSFWNLERMGQGGERSIIFKTDIAKHFLFPEQTNEIFMTESVVYDRYNGKYKFLVLNESLTICEYQNGGLSSNPRKLMVRNPAGYKLYFSQRLDLAESLIARVKYAISYNAFRYIYNGTAYEYNGPYKFLIKALRPLGFLLALKYERKYR